MKKKILNVVLIILLIASMFVLTACGEENEKTVSPKDKAVAVVEDFYEYAADLKYREMFEMIDFAGMSVYQELGEENLDEFKTEYETYIESEEWKEVEGQMEDLIDSMVEMMDGSEGEDTMATTEILNTEVEEISKDLYKVDAEIKTIDTDGEEDIEDLAHYVFKSGNEYKIVYADGI